MGADVSAGSWRLSADATPRMLSFGAQLSGKDARYLYQSRAYCMLYVMRKPFWFYPETAGVSGVSVRASITDALPGTQLGESWS